MRALTRCFTHLSKKAPLRAVLIIPFVLQILLVVGLTGYLSYLNGQASVQDLVGQLEREISDRVDQKLESYLSVPHLLNRINADNVRMGLLDLADMDKLEEYIWRQFQQFQFPEVPTPKAADRSLSSAQQRCEQRRTSSLTFIALATETGNYIDVGYNPSGQLEMTLRDRRKDDITRIWALNDWGTRTRVTNTLPDYDPRQRPWYTAAVSAGSQVWVDPYLTRPYSDLSISADRPMFSSQGVLLGVTDATLSLSGISAFLCDLQVGKTGQVFIVEPNGRNGDAPVDEWSPRGPKLIASSTGEALSTGTGETQQRVDVLNSSNELTRATAKTLVDRFGSLGNIPEPTAVEFWLHGQRHFVKARPFPGILRSSPSFRGLNWLVVVAVPQSDFMERINANTRNTIVLCLAALGAAIALGVVTSRWITDPILRLSQSAEALANGNWDHPVRVQRSGELGTLAHAFDHMRYQLKQSHQQLEEYSHGLEQKNSQLETLEADLRRQLNLFLHAVSHDLRNPVLGTSMVLNNLSKQPGDELLLPRRILTRMSESNQRQLDLINSLIDTHAAEIWGISLQCQPLSLGALVDSAIADLQPILEREQTQIINQISLDLPPILADSLQLTRVYQNLIANALKHNPPGLTLTLAAAPESGWMQCTVRDNGIGIQPEHCAKLFNPYVRGEQKPKSIGLGLGLYLCQQIVQAHGGTIGIESQPGAGAIFWFTLPLA